MATCDYGCAPLEAHSQVICGDYENGGQPSVAIIDCDAEISDYSDEAQWQTAIDAGLAVIISNVRAQLEEAAPVEVTNPVGGSNESFTANYDRVLSWVDNNVLDSNVDMYNTLSTRRTFVAIFNPSTNTIRVNDQAPADFQVMDSMPESSGELTGFMASARWRFPLMMNIYPAPAGIFL